MKLINDIRCRLCGTSITHKRMGSTYCSNRCRQRQKRQLKKQSIINELTECTSKIPGETIAICNVIIKIKDENILQNGYGFIDVYSLNLYSEAKLKKLLSVKKSKLVGITIGSGIRSLITKYNLT